MYIGQVTGGSLKTTAQADSESLQAGWFSKQELNFTHMRASDILPLIETGREWTRGRTKHGGLPVLLGHVSSSLRLILVAHDNAQLVVLTRSGQGSTSFPVVDSNDFHQAMEKELKVGILNVGEDEIFRFCDLSSCAGTKVSTASEVCSHWNTLAVHMAHRMGCASPSSWRPARRSWKRGGATSGAKSNRPWKSPSKQHSLYQLA